ncbi:helicase protein MOM1-like protein isoform X1 [Tanacetum coccineum]
MAKNKDIPPVSLSGSAENTRKSTRFENQTAPVITSVKKRPEKSEKQVGPSRLRRSERGKNPVDVPASNIKSAEEKTADISKESAEDVNNEMREVGGRKRKRFNAIRFKALFKPQRVQVESDDEEDSEDEDGTSILEAKTSSNGDGGKEMVDRDKGVDKCSDEADGQSVQASRARARKVVLEEGLIASDQEEHVGCPSQTKPVEGESVESGNVEKQIGGNCSPSNGHIADSDNHVSHTSVSRQVSADLIYSVLVLVINHVLENQQERDFRDKVTGTCEPAGVMENAENNIANTNIQNAGSIVNSSKFVEYWVPVQLSNAQLEQYCASLLSNATVFQSCSKRATDEALLEILNSNRKCCNHPYLVDAKLQGKIIMDLKPTRILDVDIKVSGKLQFLDLVLPEVKKRQLRVLILYQPTSGSASVGPVLAEFVHQRFGEDSYERLDGVGIVSSKKQTALSNFNNEKDRFIFLLVYNACNSTIKLSSIDLVIIFDSDLNPLTDIKLLQKISIDSQSEQMMVIRLYTSLTLEEKILKLADHDDMIQNLRSKYDALLMWGASDLFNRLEEFHSQSDINILSEESILNNVVKEFLHIISRKSESDDTTKSFITRVESCGNYGKNIMFHSEMKTLLPDGDHPRVFWKKLLEGRNPVWKFRSESTPRQRKRPIFFSDSCGVNTRRKFVKNVVEGETGRSNEGVPVQNESRLSPGDHFWSTTVGNETSVGNEKILHDLLKPTVSELCKKLKFSENVTTIVESFLKFVIDNFQVFKEHTSTLQAFMISVCWIGSSLSGYMIDMIDRVESFALAKKDLNFICSKEEADQVYEKLQSAKEKFLQNTKDLEIVNNIEECTMPHQEPRMSNSVPLDPQESKPENRDSSNEETLQSDEQIIKEDLARKDKNEIDKFNRVWDEKRMDLEKNRQMDEAFIRLLHPTKSSLRSEMLDSVQKDFTKKLKEHERLRAIDLSDLKAKLKAAVGQVVVNDEHSLHGPAHETQIVDLVRSEKGDQGSPEVPPALSGNPSEAQIHDKPLHEMSPVVVPTEVVIISDDDSDRESIGSHSSENQTADAMVKSEPITNHPAIEHVDMENDVTVDNEPIVEIVSSIPIEENASELHDEVENDLVRADATVINKPIGEISAKLDADMENDKAGQAECVEMEVLEVDTNKENPKACIVEVCNETGHDDLASHVDSAEMEMLAVDDMSQNVESADGSHAAEDTVRTSHDGATPDGGSADMGIPTASGMPNGTDMERNLESTDGSHAVEDPVGTSPNGVAPHVESIEMGLTADKGMPTGNCMEPNLEPVDGSHAVGDPNASGPVDVALHIESAELGIPAVECNKENADDGTVRTGTSQGVEDHNLTSGSSSSSSSSSSTDVAHAVSDHSVPPIHDIQSECLQVQQPPDSGIQDQEVQAKSTPEVQFEDNNLRPVEMGQVDQIMLDNSSPDPHNEPIVVAETPISDPVITENQSAIVPMREVQTTSESMVAAETLIINPMITENQTAILPMSEALSQTTLEPIVAVVTPIATHPQIQNAAPLEPDDVAPHEESAELRISAVECNKENADDGTMSAGTSHGVENLKDSSDSSSRLSLSSAGVAHVASDDSVPVIRDIQNGSPQVQLLHDSGIQDEEVQAESTPMVEIEDNSLQFMDMGQGDPIIPDDSSPNSHNEPFVAAETPITDPMVTEDQSATLPASAVSAQTTSEPIVAAETPITDPIITEDQSATLPASEVLAPTTSEPIVAAETPITEPIVAAATAITGPVVAVETPITEPIVAAVTPITEPNVAAETAITEPIVAVEAPITEPIIAPVTPITEPIVAAETPITAHTQIQNASQLERIFDLQQNGNFNQLGSRRMYPGDPLHLELQRLHSGKENMVKMHQENMQKISVDCEKEIAEVTAQIRLKYGNKRQEAETAFNSQYQEVESNMHKVAWNKVLAAAFRSKCKDLTPDHAGLQQGRLIWTLKFYCLKYRCKS